MTKIRVLIPAAGRGTRANLPFPKTLYEVNGRPILHRLLETFSKFDDTPTIIVSPDGEPLIRESLSDSSFRAHLITQHKPTGMGDAVLLYDETPTSTEDDIILLAWGDLVCLQESTLSVLVKSHITASNDFTFATRTVNNPYTRVKRNDAGDVLSVIETREDPTQNVSQGERDIGLFIFRKSVVFPLLSSNLAGMISPTTNEHGFLYVIEHLVQAKHKVQALPIATELDLVSLNSLSDLDSLKAL